MQVELRPATAADHPFLVAVYASVRAAELAPLGWSEEQRRAFVVQQYDAQARAYATYDGLTTSVILADQTPVGRLIVARWPAELRVADIAVLDAHRNRGIASEILGDLLAEAAAGGLAVTIHVEETNPAAALYRRLGFAPEGDVINGVYRLWRAQPKTAS